jgi:hypothetical protein
MLVFPDKSFYNAHMNATDVTTGAYYGSNMVSDGLTQALATVKADFGESHVLTYRNQLANAVSGNSSSKLRVVLVRQTYRPHESGHGLRPCRMGRQWLRRRMRQVSDRAFPVAPGSHCKPRKLVAEGRAVLDLFLRCRRRRLCELLERLERHRGPAGFPNRIIGRARPAPWRNYVRHTKKQTRLV